MGTFDITSVNYNKQSPIEYYNNGTSVFTSNACASYTPPTYNTTYSSTIPNGCSGIAFILIGGGGGAQGTDNINERSGYNGGGGGFLFINCSVTSGMTYSITSGSAGIKGTDTPFQGDGTAGTNSSLTIGSNTFTANGGGYGTSTPNGGDYTNPSTTGITVYQSYGGIGQNGAGTGNYGPSSYNGLQQNIGLMPTGEFDSTYYSYGQGGFRSGGSNGIAIMYFHY